MQYLVKSSPTLLAFYRSDGSPMSDIEYLTFDGENLEDGSHRTKAWLDKVCKYAT